MACALCTKTSCVLQEGCTSALVPAAQQRFSTSRRASSRPCHTGPPGLSVGGGGLRRAEDPEPLKLLKRQLAVAIGEEDYRQAARLRDHPYMALHLEALRMRRAGRPQAGAPPAPRNTLVGPVQPGRLTRCTLPASTLSPFASPAVTCDSPAGSSAGRSCPQHGRRLLLPGRHRSTLAKPWQRSGAG